MHCMVKHVKQFFEIHGAIMPFTQQGLEKYNDFMTKDYFRGSSHRGEECLKQVMQKQNRMEHLQDSKCSKRFEITCHTCQQKGHNKRTCSSVTY